MVWHPPGDITAWFPTGDRFALDLAGWEDRSIWGVDVPLGDPGQAYLFAQLWRNEDSDRDEPTIWISAASRRWPETQQPAILAGYIAEATEEPVGRVLAAMAAGAPAWLAEDLSRKAPDLPASAMANPKTPRSCARCGRTDFTAVGAARFCNQCGARLARDD